MAKPVSLSIEAQLFLKKNSSKLTIPEIVKMYNITYNKAIHYIRFNGLPYKGTKGGIKQKNHDYGNRCHITGFPLK